eukprot:gene25774-34355_t
MTEQQQVVAFGDYIILSCAYNQNGFENRSRGWLSSEGIASDDCFLLSGSGSEVAFDDCIWEVYIQGHYSALREYREAIRLLEKNENKIVKAESTSESLHHLHSAAINERKLNDKIMQTKRGKAIRFGDVIQLRHVKSKKFLTVSYYQLAEQERENMKVTVERCGSTLSGVCLLPVRKQSKEGQPILHNNEVIVRIHEKPTEYIHATNKDLNSTRCGLFSKEEVNCSLDPSSWTLNLYRKAQVAPTPRHMMPSTSVECILAGQTIVLQDPNNLAFMTVTTELKQLDSVEAAEVALVPDLQAKFGNTFTSKDNAIVGTSYLWLVEKAEISCGGTINLRDDAVTLKHVNSNLYMKMDENGVLVAVQGRDRAGLFQFRQSNSNGGAYTESLLLLSGSEVLFSCESAWVGIQGNADDTKTSSSNNTKALLNKPDSKRNIYKKFGVKTERSDAMPLIVRAFYNFERHILASSKSLQLASSNVHVGVTATKLLRRFQDASQKFISGANNQYELHLHIQAVFNLFNNLNHFLCSPADRTKLQNPLDASSDGLKFKLLLDPVMFSDVTIRQSMMREQGLLDVLLDIIVLTESNVFDNAVLAEVAKAYHFSDNKRFQSHQHRSHIADRKSLLVNAKEDGVTGGDNAQRKLSSISALSSKQKGTALGESKMTSYEKAMYSSSELLYEQPENNDINDLNNSTGEAKSLSHTIAARCLHCLLKCIEGNFANRLYISDHILIILTQIKRKQNLAVLCLQELLHNNLAILQTKIRRQEIDILIDIMQEMPMDSNILRLIQRTLTSPGGVDATQRMVTYALFGRPTTVPHTGRIKADSNEDIFANQGNNSNIVRKAVAKSTHTKSSLDFELEQPDMGTKSAGESDGVARKQQQLIIKIHLDKSKLTPSEWHNSDIYTPSSGSKGDDFSQELMDHTLYSALHSKGLPEVWVSWETTKAEYSMLNLFGCHEKVPLSRICDEWKAAESAEKSVRKIQRPKSPGKLIRKSPSATSSLGNKKTIGGGRHHMYISHDDTTNSSTQATALSNLPLPRLNSIQRKQVGDYFITQLYVIADLCLDRNYVAIGIVQRQFTYEALLTILKIDSIPNEFKAAACRLLRCLFIDREPQTKANFPRYIRSIVKKESASTTGSSEVSTEIFGNNYPYKFSLLQQLISEYLQKVLNTTALDALSTEMTALLEMLFHFGFYINPSQIQVVLLPLNNLLKSYQNISNKNVEVMANSDANISIKNKRIYPISWFRTTLRWLCGKSVLYERVFPRDEIQDQESDDNLNNENLQSWESRWLDVTETLTYMSTTIIIVFAAVAVAFLQLFLTNASSDTHGILHVLDLLTTAIFAADVSLRLFCYVRVNRRIFSFWSDVFNMIDTALVLVDMILLGIGGDNSYSNAGRASRTLKIIRLLRLLRLAKLVRAARLVREMRRKARELLNWKLPNRYKEIVANTEMGKTIVNALRIHVMIFDRLQDGHLELLVEAFKLYSKIDQKLSPIEAVEKLLSSLPDSNDLALSLAQILNIRKETPRLAHSELKEKSIVIGSHFHHTLLDLIMYEDQLLALQSLHLLMHYDSQASVLFNIAERTQLLGSFKVEGVFKNLRNILKELRRLAEMFEIWFSLESEENLETCEEMTAALCKLRATILVKNDDKSLDIRALFKADEEVQMLLRNLDAFALLVDVEKVVFDGGRSELKPPLLKILQLCNEVACWFCKNCPENQAVAFTHLAWFVSRADDKIGSTRVVRAILEGNKDLIKRCPRQYIAEFAQKILYNGQDPVYLDMYVGLTELSEICDSRVPAVENELSTVLTSREWRQYVLLWCSDTQPESEAYNRRRQQMVTVQQHSTVAAGQHALEVDINNTSDDTLYVESVFTSYNEMSLTPDLRYHIKILTILAHCNLGPKLNAIYQVKDLLFAILDPTTIQPVRKALGYLLLEIMKTQAGIEKVEKCHYFWKFLQSTVSFYERLSMELSNQSFNKDPLLRLERGEWLDLTLSIIVSFFDSFDPANLSETLENQTSGKSSSSTNNNFLRDVNFHSLMKNLRSVVKRLLEFSSTKVGETLNQILSIVLVCLQQYTEEEKDEEIIDGIGSSTIGIEEEGELLDDKADGQITDEAVGSTAEPALAELKLIKASRHRTSILQEDTQQIYFKNKFLFFVGKIKIAANAVDMRYPIVSILSHLPLKSQESRADLRFEPLIEKLTRLIFAQIERSDTHRVISSSGSKVSLWLLHVFEQMIEKASGVSTDNAFSSLVDEEKKAITTKSGDASIVNIDTLRSVFGKNDVVTLCLDLMAPGIDDELSLAAMKVLIALLRTNDGCGVVQMTVYKYLKERDSYMFFEFLRDMIEGLKLWASKVEDDFIPFLTPVITYASPLSSLSTALEAVPKTGVAVLDILQLLCEGSGYHCIGIKNIIREQTGNAKIVPILESLAAFLGVLSKNCTLGESSEVFNIINMKLLLAGFQTVIRMSQGPCVGNQEVFILHTELLVSINRVLRSIRVHPPNTRPADIVDSISGSRPRSRSEIELKNGRRRTNSSMRLFRSSASAETESGAYLRWVMYMFEQGHVYLEKVKEALVDVIESITEAQNRNSSLVMERVITTIDLSMMHTLILPTELEYLMQKERDKESSNSSSTGGDTLRNDRQTKTAISRKYMALSRNLGDNFGREMTAELARGDIVSVEVLWNNANQTIYFPIPEIVNYLSHESRDHVLSEISLHIQASQEQQLQAFCAAAHALFEECAHQQFLYSYGLAELWTTKYYLTRVMFVNAIIMNCLILAYFGTVSNDSVHIAGNTDAFDRRSLASSSSSSSSTKSHSSDVLYMQPDVNTIIFAMNCAQILFAACTVIILFITRVPIAFFSKLSVVRRNAGSSGGEHGDLTGEDSLVESFSYAHVRQLVWAALQTATDPLPLWYVVYLSNAVLALLYHRLFLSVLLLDWVVLDSITLDLLKAILNPVQQLAATLLIIVIIVNIFAAIIFDYFLEDFDGGFAVNNLWDTLKASIFYGFRGEYGIDHEMVKTLGTRLVLDVAFYIIVLAILRQIFFAIIVDTFSKLREEKFERELEANNKCFVCGIERLALDKFSGPTHGDQAGSDSVTVIGSRTEGGSDTRSFGHHRKVIHNVHHYLYLILKIWAQPPTRDNGLEMYVRRCLRRGDVSWFPMAAADHNSSHLHGDGPSTSTHVTNGQHGLQSHGPIADSHHPTSRRVRSESSSSLPPPLDLQPLQSGYPNSSASQLREFDPTQSSPSTSPPPSPDVFVGGGVAQALNSIEQQLRVLMAPPPLRTQSSLLASPQVVPSRGMNYADATIAIPASLPTAVPVPLVNYCYIREDVLQQLTESVDSAGRALEMMDHRIKSLEEKLAAKKGKPSSSSTSAEEGCPISDEEKI